MTFGVGAEPPSGTSPGSALDRWLARFSALWLPLGVLAFSVFALLQWPAQHAVPAGQAVTFQAAQDSAGQWTSDQPMPVLQALAAQPELAEWNARLVTAPLWTLLRIAPGTEARMLDFPSRHASAMRCWDAQGQSLGAADRSSQSGGMRQSRAGFALELAAGTSAVLCQTMPRGPARFTAEIWSSQAWAQHQLAFQREAGLLDGGILVLAVFILVAGLLNREQHYLIFASWLVVNLRMAALSAGWDHQWLGQEIPYDWLLVLRPLTLALYYTVTIVLFRTLFLDTLKKLGHTRPINFIFYTTLPVLVLSLALPYETFLPVIWATTAVGVVIYIYLLGHMLIGAPSRMAVWYAASIGIALVASVYEVAAAALGLTALIGTVNSVTAALASTLLTALAVAERMRQEHEDKLVVQAELQNAFRVNPIGLFTLDANGRFLSTNPALNDMLGPTLQQPGQDDWTHHFGAEAWRQLAQQTQRVGDAELPLTAPNPQDPNHPRHYLVKAAWSNGRIEGSLQDVTATVQAKAHLEFLANHDPLTKTLNRRGIEFHLQRGLEALTQGQPLAVAYLDLDRFKLINDLYGHAAGDEVLKQVCARIEAALQPRMTLGRVGGDEFLLVMGGTPLALAETVCRHVIAELSQEPYTVGERAFQVRASLGLVEVHPGVAAKEVVSTADRACREAKKDTRTGLKVYDRDSHAFSENEAELLLVERLASGQGIDGLYLEMQPIMSLRAPYESLNFEVLLRMQDEHGSRIPTERLINAGEHAGRMSAIDRWVLTTVLDWLKTHHGQLSNNQFICMNLSGASLNDERFVQFVYEKLESSGPQARQLCLEITESVALHDMENTRRFIDRVRSTGARIALDDFGAGYTSFTYLKELPADLLKIDGSFIVNMHGHPANISIVEAIVSLAQNLGMKTIAEWAEDHDTVRTLAEIGVDYVQGFVVARPQAPQRLLEAHSGADFIQDPDLKRYLSSLKPEDHDLANIDLVLGAPDVSSTQYPGAASSA